MSLGENRLIEQEWRTIRRGIVDAHIAFARRNTVAIAVVCFHFDLEGLSEADLLKIVRLIQEQTDYAPLQICDEGTLMTFIKDMHLHHCVQMIKTVQERIIREIGVKMSHGALTIIDKEDNYDTLTTRLKRYLEQAKEMGEGRICYGTARYDFCAKGGDESIFANFFSENRQIDLYNFYNGVPLSEKVEVLNYKDGVLRLKTSLAKAAFLKNEPFTFIRHPLLPDTIKADIVQTIPNRAEVILTRLRFVDSSPVDRENIRIIPEDPLEATIECPDGAEIEGYIYAIAVNSVAIRLEDEALGCYCFETKEKHVMIAFDLPLKEGKKSHMRISAILRYKKDGQYIFSIYPNHFFKQQIESYIALQQTRLIAMMQKMVLNFYQG